MAALRLGDRDGRTLHGPGANDLETDDGELGERLEQEGLTRSGKRQIQRVGRTQEPERFAVGTDERREQERTRSRRTRRDRRVDREHAGYHIGPIAHRMLRRDPADRSNPHRGFPQCHEG